MLDKNNILIDRSREDCLAGIAEQVNKLILEFQPAHGFPAMDESQQRTLKGQIAGLANTHNPVLNLMGRSCDTYFCGNWLTY